MNCIVPLAGPDFAAPSYGIKPLFMVEGEPLLLRALRSRAWYRSGLLRHESIVFVLRRIPEAEQLETHLAQWFPGSRTVWLSALSQGALMSALAGCALLRDPAAPVLIDLVDILFDSEEQVVDRCLSGRARAVVPWFRSDDPAYSYAELAPDGVTVLRTAEKRVISHHASAGVYCFADEPTFLGAAACAIRDADRHAVNGVHFICPAMNGVIAAGGRVEGFEVALVKSLSKSFKA